VKRFLVALIAIAALAFSTGLGRSTTAGAADEWCWEDPIVSIDGYVVHIDIGMSISDLAKLTGPVNVTVRIPQGVPASVICVDASYFSENVNIEHSGKRWKAGDSIPVDVSVDFQATGNFKVAMQITYVAGGLNQLKQVNGSSSQGLHDRFSLPGVDSSPKDNHHPSH